MLLPVSASEPNGDYVNVTNNTGRVSSRPSYAKSDNVGVRAATPQITPPWSLRPLDTTGAAIEGQFDPDVEVGIESPVYDVRDGLAGGKPWLRHVGNKPIVHRFTFHFIADSIFDTRPLDYINALRDMITVSRSNGRPPLVSLQAGEIIVSGYLVDVPEQIPTETWFKRGLIRSCGPVTLGLFETVGQSKRSSSTVYHSMSPSDNWLSIAARYYNDAALCVKLRAVNQGVGVGDTAVIPSLDSGALDRWEVSPFFGG